METQAHTNMAHGEIQEERTTESVEESRETEKQFLKDLYIFMKKRDMPIERIPNLGFKQIDLYVMFKTVRELGGYHQVTAQQLWKQVYNMLGGNPRSTSAATCTRKHYEKLLLPYECHIKGISMNILPHHQPKHFPFTSYSEDDDGQRPAKRKLLSIPLRQNPHVPLSDHHGRTFHLPFPYTHVYQPRHTVMPPYVPISSSVLTPLASQHRFSFEPYHINGIERVKEPLERLRSLAERYKTSSGLMEPLNLSVKASNRETNSNPASSFAPPSSNKSPKFLNKPSPLYTPKCPQRCEIKDGEAGSGDTANSYHVKARETYAVDVKATTDGPTLRTDEGPTTTVQNPGSPKTDFTIQPKEGREGSPKVREPNLSHILPSLPQENGGDVEIEIPLSVFHNWLRLCRSSSMMHGDKQLPTLPTLEQQSGQKYCHNTDVLPNDLTYRINPKHQSSVPEDLRLRQSPTPAIQTTGNHHNTSQNPFTKYRPLPSSGILKNAASQDVYPFDQQDINKSYIPKPPNCWDAYDQETQGPRIQVKMDSNPLTVQQKFASSKSYNEDLVQGGKDKSQMGPSAVLMMDPSSASLLQLTTEEVMKLKKIISSSM
ncbi:AT-rich interaction domain 6 [Dicentrarchus labrax]|uniref:AT-rich interaction domain 6 n=1 Tax=Dicentrarchus labrax TaxID=13489 RepID=UPI0021F594FB|nr:AT-rich interaction domain 6 [Dicentrarchus labrax]